MSKFFVGIMVICVTLIGVIFLQIFLSKQKNKWFGLLLPFICLVNSFLMVFQIAIFDDMSAGEIFTLFVTTFLITNIPTVIFIVIYCACREKFKHNKEIEKMNIQDL